MHMLHHIMTTVKTTMIWTIMIIILARIGNITFTCHTQNVLPFSDTNQLGLGNYLSNQRTKFGENQWKIASVSIDESENFVTAEVSCCTCTVNTSVWAAKGITECETYQKTNVLNLKKISKH